MLSRLIDPTTHMPREPALWLVLAAVISTQLLAFYLLCTQQVHKAQARHAEARAARLAQTAPPAGPMAPTTHYADRAVPAAFVLR